MVSLRYYRTAEFNLCEVMLPMLTVFLPQQYCCTLLSVLLYNALEVLDKNITEI